jgi:hypothetical protein
MATTDSSLYTLDRAVFVATAEVAILKLELTGTSTISRTMKWELTHPRMRLQKPRMPGASTIKSEQTDAGDFGQLYPSTTSMTLYMKFPTEST